MMRRLVIVILWALMQTTGYAQVWRDPTVEPSQVGSGPTGQG